MSISFVFFRTTLLILIPAVDSAPPILNLGQELPDTNLAFYIKEPGVFYIDDVRIEEDSLIKNGSFNAGFAGYEAYVDSSADASYVVDSLTEDNAADFTINNTGDAAWKIQLKQNNIELEKDQWYKLTLDAKSSLARKLMFNPPGSLI